MILDTNFIVDFLKDQGNAKSKMQQLIDNQISFKITAPSIFELWGGLVFLNKGDKEKIKIISLLKDQITYSLNNESAEEAGKIFGELKKRGLEISPLDSMIAGIAKINNQKIITNDEHFKRIEGIEIVNY